MPSKPEKWTLQQVAELPRDGTWLVATAAVRSRAAELPFPIRSTLPDVDSAPAWLIVVGGGTLIDRAKYWRAHEAPATRLAAIPSLWGSGAEVSPVVVLDDGAVKDIHIGDEYLPDAWAVWPELAATLPDKIVRHACGDAWSHALEGFLSPLADDTLQQRLADVIRDMQGLPCANDPRWFEASAAACRGQAESSVGLVHGIAHTLENPLRDAFPAAGWGHARLCALFLAPVMAFNRDHGDKFTRLAERHHLDMDAIDSALQTLHDPGDYAQALPLLEAHWPRILRDPCTRTNSALVRPSALAHFLAWSNR